ncbi:MAG: hypothetical protein IPM61_16275 [Chlorobi bacterium]|nr:MAG: hypothetical protein UZ07_CHB004000411 [Chlorobi bacterium OLB7]MBK8912861.1 hypothetical protein [Chlorobiota bacterium]MBX7218027.1 hypothetical protein [Candidatus Kapabacteria bacterium]
MSLSLQAFLSAGRDFEASRYRILEGLRRVRQEFTHNRIYPTLSELTELYVTLRTITDNSTNLRDQLPGRIVGLDLQGQRVIYRNESFSNDDVLAVQELIRWAMPLLQQAIEEGQTIFNFVDDHLRLEHVGLLPSYVEEGYLLIPELQRGVLHVIQYEVSIFTSENERYRNLRTTSVRTVSLNDLGMTAASLKMLLIAENRSLPNPATYIFQTDLDFPFAETMLPVAKRKLLRRLFS